MQHSKRQQEFRDLVILQFSDCLGNGNNAFVKTVDTNMITLLLVFYARFRRSYDIMVDFSFGGNRCFFEISRIPLNIPYLILRGLLFLYVVTRYDAISSFFNLSKLGH